MRYKQGIDRSQSTLFPALVDDYISEDNAVRFIEAYVESLEMVKLGFTHSVTSKTGCPPYAPSDMLKLHIYGYLNKTRSSRLLEQLTHRNIEVMWLMRNLQPDFKTIADFRKDNIQALKKVCREFTLLCKKLNLFAGELVAIDGSKFSAVNHNSRSYSKEKLERLINQIDEKVAEYFMVLGGQDKTEEQISQPSKGIIEETIAKLQFHKAELEELQKTLIKSGETQISLTDPDSRMMRTGHQGRDVCYNVQIAVDEQHKLIVAHEVTNEVNDLHQLAPMAQAAKEMLDVVNLDVTADKGYYNETQIAQCEQENINCYIPEPNKSQNKAIGLYTDRDFQYDKVNDCYICPANEQLTKRSKTIKGNKEVDIYETKKCKQCLLRSRCTRSQTNNRHIYRSMDKEVIEIMRERMKQYPEKTRQRKGIVEHPFGIIKHWMNHEYFLLRGINKVAAEVSMSVLVFNMKRVLNILDVPTLIKAINEGNILSFLFFLAKRRLFFVHRLFSRVYVFVIT